MPECVASARVRAEPTAPMPEYRAGARVRAEPTAPMPEVEFVGNPSA